MPITHIEINGYRSLRKAVWFPGNLNVVIGPNGTGKSNFLKFLRLIRTCAAGQMLKLVRTEGGMGAITWNGSESDVGFVIHGRFPHDGSELFDYSASLKRMGVSPDYLVTGEFLVSHGIDGNVFKSGPTHIRRAGDPEVDARPTRHEIRRQGPTGFVLAGEETIQFTPLQMDSSEALLSQLKGPYTSDFIRRFAAMISSWAIHDDMHTEAGAEIRRPTTSRHDERLEDGAQNLTAVLHTYYETDTEFRESINLAMGAAFGEEYEGLAFPPAGSQQVELCVQWKSLKRPQPAVALSDGTLRFLAIIAALSMPNPPALICIDEPETGLHPSMMRLVAEYAEDAVLRSQIIFTTHSDAFLDAFSTDPPPRTTVATVEDGETKLKTVDPDLLSRWLAEYSLGALYRSLELEQMPPARGDAE
jgi:predicted ATPase